jgi:UDP-3-O-[3-hydroxymyristoyl] glucosamine N-acyltransferase
MADPRFFKNAGPFSVAEIAEISDAEVAPGGDPERRIADVAALDAAGPNELSFIDNRRYLAAFKETGAGACIVERKLAGQAPEGVTLLLSDTPHTAYAKAAQAFYPEPRAASGVHATASIDASAKIGAEVHIGAHVVIGANAEIGDGCQIHPQVVIEDGVVIGAGTVIFAGSTLSHCLVGRNCFIHAGVRIGNRGFGFTMDPSGFHDVPQLGRVVIEDGVEIGANSTIDRGALPDTVIGAGSKIDNLVQLGHNVRVGRGCVLVAQCGVAGSTQLEDHVMLAAQSGIAGHLTLHKGSRVAAKSGVMRDVPEGETVGGLPAIALKDYFR